jgi:uncharacterized protein (TIGR02118 family)
MIVRTGLLQKRPDLTMQDFHAHWAGQHASLARALPGLRASHQNRIVEAAQRGIDFHRGSKDYDGFSQLWFDDMDGMEAAIDAHGASLLDDEQLFLGQLDVVITTPNTVIPAPEDAVAVKRMSTLRRRPELSEEDFRREWGVHAGLVKRMPGVEGYVQHVVVARAKDSEGEKSKTPSATYDDVPVDGIVEMWFRDLDHLEAAFSSPEGQVTMRHATTFLQDINTYLVHSIRVL